MLSDQKDGNFDVWVEDIESGTRVRLTTGPETDIAGAWSSSGERVALMSGLLGQRSRPDARRRERPGRTAPVPVESASRGHRGESGLVARRTVRDLSARTETSSTGTWRRNGRRRRSRSLPSPSRRAGSRPTGGSWPTCRTSRDDSRSTCARSRKATGSGPSRRTGARRPDGAGAETSSSTSRATR